MIAYNKEWLDNEEANVQIENAYEDCCITKEEKIAALAKFPSGFYTPNVFVRIGLSILTAVIIAFSFALLTLAFLNSALDSERSVAVICIIFGFLCYAVLEWFVHNKNHHQSGVDDALMRIGFILIVTGLNFLFNISPLGNSIIIFLISVYFTLRFGDKLMAILAAISTLAVVLYSLLLVGGIAQAIIPFALMLASASMYFWSKKLTKIASWRHYKDCIFIIGIIALICFYLSGNYFIVRETSVELLEMELASNENISFAWVFWIFTVTIPILYIVWGIIKKDPVLLRTGLLLIGGMIFTVRYYYQVLPIENAMLIGGVLIILTSYFFIKYLKLPKAGFTSEELRTASGANNLEALIIAETLSSQQQPQSGNQFGGGDFGGGGATGSY